MITMSDELFLAAKRELLITWEDVDTDGRVLEHLNNGAAEIDRIAGMAQDYTSPGTPRRLLFEYARYARAEALNEWRQNYRSELIGLQVDRIAREAEADETTETAGTVD